MKNFLILLMLFTASFTIKAADNIKNPNTGFKSYIEDNDGNLLPLGIAYTTDGNGTVTTLTGLATLDEIVSPANSGSMYMRDSGGNLYPAMVLYTTDGNGSIMPVPAGGSGSVSWGDIIGTLADQTDLAAALNNKVNVVAGKQLSTEDFSSALLTKLNGIASGATANQTDAYLLSRTNHTGSQAISTVTGLQAALDGKEPTITGTTSADLWDGSKAFTSKLGLPISTATQAALDLKENIYTESRTILVDKNGSDSSCVIGRPALPCLTIQKAIDLATAAPSTFNTPYLIKLNPGKYTEDLSFTQQGITLTCVGGLYHSDHCQIFGGITINLSGVAGGGNFVAGNNNLVINSIELYASGSKNAVLFSGTAFQRLYINQSFINQTTANAAFSALMMSNTGTNGGTRSTITSRSTDWSNQSNTNATVEMQAGRFFVNGDNVDISNNSTANLAILISGSAAAGPSVNIDTASITGLVTLSDNTAVLQYSNVAQSCGTAICITGPASPNTGYFVGGNNLFTTSNASVIGGTGVAVLSANNFCGSSGCAVAATVTQAPLVPLPQGEVRLGAQAVVGTNVLLSMKDGHIKVDQTTSPTVAVNANAGTSATCTLSNASDSAGTINLTEGSASWASGTQCTITFNKAYGVAPICIFSANNAATAAHQVSQQVNMTTTTTTLLVSFGVAESAATAYKFMYHCFETK